MERTEPALVQDEIPMMREWLRYHRDTLRLKCEGLTQEQLARPLPPSTLTLGGLMKHLALVEESWLLRVFEGGDLPEPWASAPFDEDPDWEFHSAPHDTPEQLHAIFDASTQRVDAALDRALARGGLEQESVREDRHGLGKFSLRWILVHLVEEYARHNGHADLIRESIDGQTGE